LVALLNSQIPHCNFSLRCQRTMNLTPIWRHMLGKARKILWSESEVFLKSYIRFSEVTYIWFLADIVGCVGGNQKFPHCNFGLRWRTTMNVTPIWRHKLGKMRKNIMEWSRSFPEKLHSFFWGHIYLNPCRYSWLRWWNSKIPPLELCVEMSDDDEFDTKMTACTWKGAEK
jgi:hypothetical protein